MSFRGDGKCCGFAVLVLSRARNRPVIFVKKSKHVVPALRPDDFNAVHGKASHRIGIERISFL